MVPKYALMLRMRTRPAGFIAPCLPTKTDKLPSGSQWLHEIKHDGFRIIARKTGLAQNEERKCTGREARRRGRMGQKEMAITPHGKTGL